MVLAHRMVRHAPIPKGVSIRLEGSTLVAKGPKGEIRRVFSHPRMQISIGEGDKGKEVTLMVDRPGRREKALLGTWRAHVNNMFRGVNQGFEYQLKVCYSHFPIKTAVKGTEVIIENFLGERFARRAAIKGAATKVAVKGEIVTVSGPDIEAVGQTAANIEKATNVRGFDIRVFQDGIYITHKDG